MPLDNMQRLKLSADGGALCHHVDLLESALREIRDTILLPSLEHHQKMAVRIDRLLSAHADGEVVPLRRAK